MLLLINTINTQTPECCYNKSLLTLHTIWFFSIMGSHFHQDVGCQRLRNRYKKLTDDDDDEKAARPRKRWVVRKMSGGVRGVRLARTRRFTFRALSVMLMPKSIAALCSEILARLRTEGVCPSIVFSSQWGLPVLSHSSSIRCY
uniref:Uncharacterized protein n=1 Tax=Kalanchoe fedtschenkoi TaxID=63787 RepID=A0A7N0U821_KALFE